MIPIQILKSGYPVKPKTFGEKLRKSRMDEGLKISELASMLGVSQDTIINWEIRNIEPMRKNMKAVSAFMAGEN